MFSKTFLVFFLVYFLSDLSYGQTNKEIFRNDYSYLEETEAFYKLHMTPRNWADAKQMCAQEGASLFYPENDAEATAVISFWTSKSNYIPAIFLGLSDILVEGVFETIDGRSISEVYSNWQASQPDNYNHEQDCAVLYKAGDMDDGSCNEKVHFICKKSLQSPEWNYDCDIPNLDSKMNQNFFRNDYSYLEETEAFYKLHMTPHNWADAKQMCAQEGASLFYPENDAEATAVISFWTSKSNYIPAIFLGLSDILVEGLFETIDGRSISEVYSNWQASQPDNYNHEQDCAVLYKAGDMDDGSCNEKVHFICKKSLQSPEWNYDCEIPNLDYTLNRDIGKCYKLHTTPLNWMEAHAVCRSEQSYLAVVTNQMEATYLASLAEISSNQRVGGKFMRGIYHLGFHNKLYSGWQTIKGTPLNYPNGWWSSYQPEADEDEQCGSMFYTGRLTNIDCSTKSFFICEHEVLCSNSTGLAFEEQNIA